MVESCRGSRERTPVGRDWECGGKSHASHRLRVVECFLSISKRRCGVRIEKWRLASHVATLVAMPSSCGAGPPNQNWLVRGSAAGPVFDGQLPPGVGLPIAQAEIEIGGQSSSNGITYRSGLRAFRSGVGSGTDDPPNSLSFAPTTRRSAALTTFKSNGCPLPMNRSSPRELISVNLLRSDVVVANVSSCQTS